MSKWLPIKVGLPLLATVLLWPTDATAGPVVFSAAGSNAAAIQTTVDNFRGTLGNPNNGNAAGPLFSGRREINWDGGGTATAAAGNPFAGFQVIRGALFTTPAPGTGFVQAPPTGGAQGGLATFFNNPTYATIFTTFSAPRLFVPIASNITDTTFTVPGNATVQATVSGFGAVFADVDLAGTTSIEYFNLQGTSLGRFFAPVADNGLSFLGVFFDAGERVARIRIVTGNSALGPNDGGGVDVVAMDDFIYAEPLVVPEPSTMTLSVLGALAVGWATRRKARRIGGR